MNNTGRLISLDVFRGLTIALMIIVNSPGTLHPYAWLEHSIWNGCTLADLVFPFFLVIVGMSSTLVLSRLRFTETASHRFEKIIKRSAFLFLMGLVLNIFPHHFDWSSLRILGVLQRIGICYGVASILFLTTRHQTQLFIIAAVLIGYAFFVSGFSPLGLEGDPLTLNGNIVGYLDRLLLTPSHLYTPMFDPEGILSTLPAIATTLLGNWIGQIVISSKTKQQVFHWLWILGTVFAILGWIWAIILPMNKALWSSSYVLWSGGLACIGYALIYDLIEIKQCKRWAAPFIRLGRHALLIYMLHVLLLKIQGIIHIQHVDGTTVNLRLHLTQVLFGEFSTQNASLLYSIAYTLFCMFMLVVIDRGRIWFNQSFIMSRLER